MLADIASRILQVKIESEGMQVGKLRTPII
jgi:hypothetical protein